MEYISILFSHLSPHLLFLYIIVECTQLIPKQNLDIGFHCIHQHAMSMLCQALRYHAKELIAYLQL